MLINDFLKLMGSVKTQKQRVASHVHIFPEMRLSLTSERLSGSGRGHKQ